jgi:hypothetical protein
VSGKRAFSQKMKGFSAKVPFRGLNTSISNGETKVTFEMPAFQAVITVLSLSCGGGWWRFLYQIVV